MIVLTPHHLVLHRLEVDIEVLMGKVICGSHVEILLKEILSVSRRLKCVICEKIVYRKHYSLKKKKQQ
jgi:hypothetical protein